MIRTVIFFAGILLFSLPAFAHPNLDKAYEKQGIADIKALEGRPIRNIIIEVKDVFEKTAKNRFYETVNSLKTNTKEYIVRQELLFKEGDTFDAFLLKESERNLRSQRFLRNVTLTPKENADGVDVIVSVQDTWTFIPSLSYSSGDGSGNKSIGLSESNILGYGKRAEFLAADEQDRRVMEAVYEDPRVWGSSLRFLGAQFMREDGNRTVLLLSDPFRTLVDKTSWQVDADFSDTVGKLWANGDERYIYAQENVDLGAKYTWSFGEASKALRRYSLGYDYKDNQFTEASAKDFKDVDVDPNSVSHDPALLAKDRRYTGPTLGYEALKPRFIKMAYIDRFDREEDYDIGDNFGAFLTLAPEAFSSTDDALLLNLNRSAGKKFSSSSFIRGEFGFSSRFIDDHMENSLFRAESRYYNVLGSLSIKELFLGRHTLAAGYTLDYGRGLDGDREFLLGADKGLRGYDANTFTGDKRLLINIEDRVHLKEDIYKMVSLGAAAFVDIGGTTSGPFANLLGEDLYGDAGVGLRFAFPRSSGGKILRVDIAVPFRDGADGTDGYEFRIIFAGGQVFSSKLRSETVGIDKANVEVGMDR